MMLKYYYRGEGRGGIERVSRSLQVGVIDLFIRCWHGSRLILEATLVFATDIVFSTPPPPPFFVRYQYVLNVFSSLSLEMKGSSFNYKKKKKGSSFNFQETVIPLMSY